MKKKVGIIMLTLCMCCIPFSVSTAETEITSETAEMTLEQLEELQSSFAATTQSATMNLSSNMDLTIETSSQNAPATSSSVTMDGELTTQCIVEPMQAKVSGSFQIYVLGVSQEIPLEYYMILSEDKTTMDIYARTSLSSEGGWLHQQTDLSQALNSLHISNYEELANLSTSQILEKALGIEPTLTDNGDSCTVSTVIRLADLLPAIKEVLSSGNEESDALTQEILEGLLGGLVIHISEEIQKDDGETSAVHLDLNGSDLSGLDDLVSGLLALSSLGETSGGEAAAPQTPRVSLTLKNFTLDGVLTYNNVEEIQVPADALTSPLTSASKLAGSAGL